MTAGPPRPAIPYLWRVIPLPVPHSSAIIIAVGRILVIGYPGAGKSTFATELGKLTGLPVIHLDREFWQPGWVQKPKDLWREHTRLLADRDEWIMDGSYDHTLDIRLQRADKVIFLDYSRYLCLWRVIKRVMTNHGTVRSDMADGCPEKIDLAFLKFVWNYRRDRYPIVHKHLNDHYATGELIVLKNPAETRAYLSSLRLHPQANDPA